MPPSPKSAVAIQEAFHSGAVMSEYGITANNEEPTQFFRKVFISETFSYCVFASQPIIDRITEHIPAGRRNFYLDATFKVVPFGEFNQLLIIHVEYFDKVIHISFTFDSQYS